MHRLRFIALVIFAVLIIGTRADEPFLKKGDVIALVGGEDMVAASEYGYLELLLIRALPDYHLKFRNLAWEGDTVFEQPRQLNFPTWEEQLDKIGATVVICQFGQMESLAGKAKLPEFVAAYEKLIERFRGGGKRRVVLIEPTPIRIRRTNGFTVTPCAYLDEIITLAQKVGEPIIRLSDLRYVLLSYRDDLHLDNAGHDSLGMKVARYFNHGRDPVKNGSDSEKGLLDLIIAKNRLWFDYWRPQNWAFLNGDRTTQPSSRDHRDPNIRWFPAEMEQFLPLIAAKEEAIWKLAAELK